MFHIGQRVKLSEKGLRYLSHFTGKVKYDKALRGTVRGHGRHPETLLVQRDGIKTINSYAIAFWEVA